jgi:hypothetical protein
MKTIMSIIAIVIVLFIAVFSVCACILSSRISKDEEYDRGDLKESDKQ